MNAPLLQEPSRGISAPSERRLGFGFFFIGLAATGSIALAQLLRPNVVHPAPLFGLCGFSMIAGLIMVSHGRARLHHVPDTPIAAAVEYLVNDSTAVLAKNPPDEVARFGPAKGREISWHGKPQEDALEKIEERLASGSLSAFGRSAVTEGESPTTFESPLRPIPEDYWQRASLHPLFGQVLDSQCAQTCARPSLPAAERRALRLYADVTLSKAQIASIWKRKPWWRRLWNRVVRRSPRIGHWPGDPAPVLELQRRVQELQGRAHDLQGALDEAKHELEDARADARRSSQLLRYGRSLADSERSTTPEYMAMLNSLHELKPSIARLQAAVDDLWRGFVAASQSLDQNSALAWLLYYVRNTENAHAAQALRALVDVLDSRRDDPRPLLGGAYLAYDDWRVWPPRLASLLGISVSDVAGYAEWQAAEAEFLSELRKKLALPLLAGVARCVAERGPAHAAGT